MAFFNTIQEMFYTILTYFNLIGCLIDFNGIFNTIQEMFYTILTYFNLIGCLIDFNGISTCLGLFYVFGNLFFVSLFLKIRFFFGTWSNRIRIIFKQIYLIRLGP